MKYRENESEPWKELYIKALDSMPIGSVVEYVGQASDIPTGWEEVGNDYSTTEINTGKTWIDGKPIYRTMFTGTISSGDYRNIGTISNLDKIIDFGGTIVDSTNNIKYVIGKSGYVDGTGISRIIAIGNNIRLDAKVNSYSNMPFEAYIEYTKTTD